MPSFAAQAMLKEYPGAGMWIANTFVYQEQQVDAIRSFFEGTRGQEFEIEITACQEISWGDNRKREAFKCELAQHRLQEFYCDFLATLIKIARPDGSPLGVKLQNAILDTHRAVLVCNCAPGVY
jgi:hypothetical protein